MGNYFDPDERDPATWRGSTLRDELAHGREEVRSVVQRALATSLPYEYRERRDYGPDVVAEEFDTRDYRYAKVHYTCSVGADGRIKLLTRGFLWGKDERHQRYKAQYRRGPDPIDVPPFEEYTVWNEYVYGTTSKDDAGDIQFEPEADSKGDYLRTVDWADLYTPVQLRLAELELVRNPAFARYRLQELDEWDEFDDALTYRPESFEVGP